MQSIRDSCSGDNWYIVNPRAVVYLLTRGNRVISYAILSIGQLTKG